MKEKQLMQQLNELVIMAEEYDMEMALYWDHMSGTFQYAHVTKSHG